MWNTKEKKYFLCSMKPSSNGRTIIFKRPVEPQYFTDDNLCVIDDADGNRVKVSYFPLHRYLKEKDRIKLIHRKERK